MITAKSIREERKRRGWTQRHLADLVGVHQPTVARWDAALNWIFCPSSRAPSSGKMPRSP